MANPVRANIGQYARGSLGKHRVALCDHLGVKPGFPPLCRLPKRKTDVVQQGRVGSIVKWLDYVAASYMVKSLDDKTSRFQRKAKTMPHIKGSDAQIFQIPDATFAGLASPSRGSRENAVWRVTLAPHAKGGVHSLSREEVLVALSGTAEARIGDELHRFAAGDAIVIPAEMPFALSNPGDAPFEAIAVLPVGAQARIGDAPAFTPPWAL